jgi:hypothetical protein
MRHCDRTCIIKLFTIVVSWRHDTQYSDTLHTDSQNNDENSNSHSLLLF